MRRSGLAVFVLLVASLVLGSTRAGAELRVFVTNEKSDNDYIQLDIIDDALRHPRADISSSGAVA